MQAPERRDDAHNAASQQPGQSATCCLPNVPTNSCYSGRFGTNNPYLSREVRYGPDRIHATANGRFSDPMTKSGPCLHVTRPSAAPVWMKLATLELSVTLKHSSGSQLGGYRTHSLPPRYPTMASFPTAVRSTQKVAHNVLRRQPISDVAITRTGKPILRTQGGR